MSVGPLECGMLTVEPFPSESIPESINANDLRDIRLRQQNQKDLRRIQEIFFVEEDRALSIDEVLGRILAFYNGFVPFKEQRKS